jgi:hypothetical protein
LGHYEHARPCRERARARAPRAPKKIHQPSNDIMEAGCHNLQRRQKLTTGNTCTQVHCRCINLYCSNFPPYSEGARAGAFLCSREVGGEGQYGSSGETSYVERCVTGKSTTRTTDLTKQSTSLHHYRYFLHVKIFTCQNLTGQNYLNTNYYSVTIRILSCILSICVNLVRA